MDLQTYEQLQPNARFEDITFLTPNQHCAWRVATLETKEPDTLAWLRKMNPGEILFDIGANMGQYSLIAAKKGLKVHAFEPEAQNFALLVRNIAINGLSDLVTAWPIALSNKPDIAVLHLSTLIPGGSCHAFGENTNYAGQTKQFPFQQGSISSTLDRFCDQYGFCDHIKLDVDGFEHKVIQGGGNVVKRCKSILIEINTNLEEHRDLVSYMTNQLGFHFDAAQVEAARRKEGPFTGVGNYIFYKD